MLATPMLEDLRQCADYTHKFNTNSGRHGWLRLTPAYSVKIVESLIAEIKPPKRIFDPFCGTGTTALSAAYHGHCSVTTDINPFLVWLAQAKTAHYTGRHITTAREAAVSVLDLVKHQRIEPAPAPPIHNIERWWQPDTLSFLRLLRAAISAITPGDLAESALLQVAFCRTLIALSNAAFNHQSLSFKQDEQLDLCFERDMSALFIESLEFVLDSAIDNPDGESQVVLGDARNPMDAVSGSFDWVITSPPYANRMSYIRELRPYMYWLGFLHNGRDAGELDWSAIGGTWGIATSRLTEWRRSDQHFESARLTQALKQIAHADNKNGALLARYVEKYFDDMWTHFQSLTPMLTHGAEIHYIVGNSTFYGALVATERLYAEMLDKLGFSDIECCAIRKRNSKKELVEFDVTAKW